MSLDAIICKRRAWGIGPCVRSLPCWQFWDCSLAKKKSSSGLFGSQFIIMILKETKLTSKHSFWEAEVISQPVQAPLCHWQCYQVRSLLTSKLSRWLCWTCKWKWLRPCSAGHVNYSFLLKDNVRVSKVSGWKWLPCGACQTISVMLLLGRKGKNKYMHQ